MTDPCQLQLWSPCAPCPFWGRGGGVVWFYRLLARPGEELVDRGRGDSLSDDDRCSSRSCCSGSRPPGPAGSSRTS